MSEQEKIKAETDQALMSCFQEGDPDAFSIIFDRYASHIINFSYRFLNNQQESEDIAQEVLLRVYKGKDRYDSSRPFRPWIFSIAARLLSNRRRDKKRHAEESLDWQSENADEGSQVRFQLEDKSSGVDPQKVTEKNQLALIVQKALKELPENQRIAVILARFEGMSYEDIAQSLDISVSAVKSLLFRARETLKQSLSS